LTRKCFSFVPITRGKSEILTRYYSACRNEITIVRIITAGQMRRTKRSDWTPSRAKQVHVLSIGKEGNHVPSHFFKDRVGIEKRRPVTEFRKPVVSYRTLEFCALACTDGSRLQE
jgi:hypothetical protein